MKSDRTFRFLTKRVWSWINRTLVIPFRAVRLGQRALEVPIILQVSEVECGAACLTMILSYHGLSVSLSDCREMLRIGDHGASALSIANAARAHGLRVRAFSLSPADFRPVRLPAIVHWKSNHFVVLEHWSLDNVEIIDPAFGRRQLTAEEFGAGFAGVVLMFEREV